MKTRGSGGIAPPLLASAFQGERVPSTHWMEGWDGPIACLDAVDRIPWPGMEPQPSSP
jgi:hypothetical protein